MNLFLNPSVDELHSLIQNAPEAKNIHDVVLDYDGEVLIDPQLELPDIDLSKFKFRVQLTEFSKRALAMGSAPLRFLFNNLLMAWNSENEMQQAFFA